MRIGVVLGSTRPQRLGERVARLVMAQAAQVPAATFEVLDLAGYELPFFDEPVAPLRSRDRQLPPGPGGGWMTSRRWMAWCSSPGVQLRPAGGAEERPGLPGR